MKILVIEDDENKRNQIVEYINEFIPTSEVETAKSYQSGLRTIISNLFDLILLDMTMPTFDIGTGEDGGRPLAYAGRDILRQMERRDINIPVIIVTQFDKFGDNQNELSLAELHEELVKEDLPNYIGAVYYNASITDWKVNISRLILKL